MTMNNNVNVEEMMDNNVFSMFEEVDEKPISGPIRLPIDFKSARANAIPINLIGRGKTMSLVVLDKNNVGKLLVHRRVVFDGNFTVMMLNSLSSIINQFTEKGLHMSILTTSNNAIMARVYRKYSSDMDILDVDAIVDKIARANRYFRPEVDDTEERVQEKQESKAALKNFVEAMVNADSHGIYVEVNKVNEFNMIMLNVPEDITVENGDILKFVNGSTENGITVQGWKNFNRDRAEVHSKFIDDKLCYFIYNKAQNRLTPMEQVIKDAIGKQWAECPNVEAKADFDSVVEENFLA